MTIKNWKETLEGKASVAEITSEALSEKDKYGNDAFLATIKFKYHDLALDMIKNLPGLDVNNTDTFGRTALHKTSNLDVAKALLAKGADIELADGLQNTPILLAVIYNRADIAKLLNDSGADLHTQNMQGQNMLHLAAYSGNMDLLKMALEAGIEDIPSNQNRTAQDYARMSRGGDPDAVVKFMADWHASHPKVDETTTSDSGLGFEDSSMELVEAITTTDDAIA